MKIGIDLGGTKTEGILINQEGKEVERKRIITEKNYNGTINGILSLVKAIFNSSANIIITRFARIIISGCIPSKTTCIN